MFRIPKANLIESDEGFSVEVLGRTGLRYREGDKSLFVDSEVLAPGTSIVISAKSIREWDPPNDGRPIPPEKKAAVIENIRRAFEFRKHSLIVA